MCCHMRATPWARASFSGGPPALRSVRAVSLTLSASPTEEVWVFPVPWVRPRDLAVQGSPGAGLRGSGVSARAALAVLRQLHVWLPFWFLTEGTDHQSGRPGLRPHQPRVSDPVPLPPGQPWALSPLLTSALLTGVDRLPGLNLLFQRPVSQRLPCVFAACPPREHLPNLMPSRLVLHPGGALRVGWGCRLTRPSSQDPSWANTSVFRTPVRPVSLTACALGSVVWELF